MYEIVTGVSKVTSVRLFAVAVMAPALLLSQTDGATTGGAAGVGVPNIVVQPHSIIATTVIVANKIPLTLLMTITRLFDLYLYTKRFMINLLSR